MKQFKRCLILSLCIVLLLSSISLYGNAFSHEKHDEYMFQCLFRNFKSKEDFKIRVDQKDAQTMLEYASYLTIDQFNNQGADKLQFLIDHGVSGIPTNIREINYPAGGSDHRSYTHRGWEFQYVKNIQELWLLRKSILVNTADKIFDFQGNERKKDSFCALIYYIHILGDHIADKSWSVKNGLKIDLGGRIDREDIIHELEKHLAILFADQKHTYKYSYLTNVLERYDKKLIDIVRSEGGINSDDKFHLKKEYALGIMKAITLYVPEMLKEEIFFKEVFYSK